MKKLFQLTALAFLIAAISMSCTKEGPMGPAGADGEDGIDGESGTAGCVECHDNSQMIFAKANQWEHSTHATGGNYERNGEDCAPCHTSQGFLEVLESGAMLTSAPISNPNPPNCYTCHNIHDTYTTDDWELTNEDPVSFWINDVSSDQGTANMCISCHQTRIPDPLPNVNDGSGSITVSSPYWGPHHGPQGPMFAGTAGYEIGTGYSNSTHTSMVDNSCVDCHMAEAYGAQAGGHNMGISYVYHGHTQILTAGCTDCHTDEAALETKIENTVLEIETLVDSLGNQLVAAGLLDGSSHRIIPGTYTNDQAGAVYNYLFVMEDRSNGIHNYDYAKKLLENSLAAVK